MPDDSRALPDTARAEVLRAAEEALVRLAPGLPADAATLLRELHAAVPTAGTRGRAARGARRRRRQPLRFAAERPPGRAKVRLLPPGPGAGPARWPRSSPTTCPSWSIPCLPPWR